MLSNLFGSNTLMLYTLKLNKSTSIGTGCICDRSTPPKIITGNITLMRICLGYSSRLVSGTPMCHFRSNVYYFRWPRVEPLILSAGNPNQVSLIFSQNLVRSHIIPKLLRTLKFDGQSKWGTVDAAYCAAPRGLMLGNIS